MQTNKRGKWMRYDFLSLLNFHFTTNASFPSRDFPRYNIKFEYRIVLNAGPESFLSFFPEIIRDLSTFLHN